MVSDARRRRAADEPAAPVRRLRRAERREQILAAATRAFARTGWAATSLDDIASEARVSRVLLYRHFESKTDMYRAALERTCQRLTDTVGTGNYTAETIPALLGVASEDPDGFRLLFRHASREPEFREFTDSLASDATDVARHHLAALIDDPRWADWASQLAPAVVIEGVIAWLDAGQPDPEHAASRIGHTVAAVIEAAQSTPR